jgi:arylformamidase
MPLTWRENQETIMKAYDLSHPLYDGLKTHASHPRVIINDFVTHAFSAPRYLAPCKGFATKQLLVSDHAGTHVDAPMHFYPDGGGIDTEDLQKFFGPALLLDVSQKPLRRPVDLALVKETLQSDRLAIRSGDMVLIRAWPGEWGTQEFHDAAGLHIEAAEWLAGQGVKAVGIDLGNIEDNADMTRKVHLFLLDRGIAIYENLANLGKLPVKRFLFMGLPLALKGCTGSPVRAVALVEESSNTMGPN